MVRMNGSSTYTATNKPPTFEEQPAQSCRPPACNLDIKDMHRFYSTSGLRLKLCIKPTDLGGMPFVLQSSCCLRFVCSLLCGTNTWMLSTGPERKSSPVHVVAEVRGIMSAQRAHCSLSLILTHSLAPLFTVCVALERCHDPWSTDM